MFAKQIHPSFSKVSTLYMGSYRRLPGVREVRM